MKPQVQYNKFLRFTATRQLRKLPAAKFARIEADGSRSLVFLSIDEINDAIKFGLGPIDELKKGLEAYGLVGVAA